MVDIPDDEDDALDLEEFLITIEAMHAAPDQFSKKDLAMMLWKAGQVIGQLLSASDEEDIEPSGDIGDMEPEGNA
ncbi:hypothetical protein NGM99_06780 [Mesorhizobium sp. RP14(2022)]|jgi:hypothetical protein|uniref:Uncharacterized protein n=1 Tax=Mesorhizobium liriopis TaxID=2953882 RepID=A0ABT1C3U6_9HYPH|nr:hypothetical protein [Mesorhizobium liriopis]MCO6049494.1 hypothetical protein [Mesorhizobium liriopis]